MTVDKDGGNIISITGATITTRTLAQSIKLGLSFIEGIAGEIETEEATKEEVTE